MKHKLHPLAKRYYKFTENTGEYEDDELNIENREIGNLVTLIRNEEGFFAEIVDIIGNNYYVIVRNNVAFQPFKFGDHLVINKRYIF